MKISSKNNEYNSLLKKATKANVLGLAHSQQNNNRALVILLNEEKFWKDYFSSEEDTVNVQWTMNTTFPMVLLDLSWKQCNIVLAFHKGHDFVFLNLLFLGADLILTKESSTKTQGIIIPTDDIPKCDILQIICNKNSN